MYRQFVMKLFLCNIIFILFLFAVKVMQKNNSSATIAFQNILEGESAGLLPQVDKFFGVLKQASSGQRIVDYAVIRREEAYPLEETDYEALLRIVQAEAGCEDEKGKMLVAGVILNRVESKKFPNTVTEVVFQQENGVYQFSPVANGTYYSVSISEDTREAVAHVLQGEDVTQGALYFAARKYAEPEKMKWFDTSLTRLFQHGGHEFFF